MTKSVCQLPHLEHLSHRWHYIRKGCADQAGHYSRVARHEVTPLTERLLIEVSTREAILDGLLDVDLDPIESVVDALCSALARCATHGADIGEAVPFLRHLVDSREESLPRISAAYALRDYEAQQERSKNWEKIRTNIKQTGGAL